MRGVKNALVVRPDGIVPSSLVIEDGRIAAIGGKGLIDGPDVLDARGRYVLPGVVDPEAHFASNGAMDWDFESETRAAVATGVTTWNLQQTSHTIFAAADGRPAPERSLLFSQLVQKFIEIGEASSCCDFVLTPLLMTEEQALEIPRLAQEWGLTTYKLYMHMRLGREHLRQAWPLAPLLGVQSFDDHLVFVVMREVAGLGSSGMVSLHCENWEIARLLEAELRAQGRDDFAAWNDRSPGFLETMHIHRYSYLARKLGCRIHIQHVSTGDSIDAIRQARSEGARIHGQTGVHYLVLDASAWKINVPLRPASEHPPLWAGLASGGIDSVGSDHIGPRRDATGRILGPHEMRHDSIWQTTTGFPSRVEAHLPLLLSEGVSKGRLTLPRLCEVTSANPARIWNLYPRKGALAPGSDADLVVVDMERQVRLSRDLVVSASGWSLYEGMEVTGWPVVTMLGGEVVAEWTGGSCWITPHPKGRFIVRKHAGSLPETRPVPMGRP